jgi:hypothetical protein
LDINGLLRTFAAEIPGAARAYDLTSKDPREILSMLKAIEQFGILFSHFLEKSEVGGTLNTEEKNFDGSDQADLSPVSSRFFQTPASRTAIDEAFSPNCVGPKSLPLKV